jgi:DNA-binding NtrC family response regulator/tetratricopeptide (TPR) repeat protein
MAPSAPLTASILGNAKQIESLRAQIERLRGFDAPGNPRVPTVLVEGETGTGKGLVARVMHDSGPRGGGPFVDVNCAAIPESMLEAELFGFEAGAFTDAKRAKPGLFEAASGGTLFLDEVDSLSAPVQSKLLKAIEEKRVRRLGAVESHDIDVKLITATQRDLRRLVEAGTFRADLYHRIAVLVLAIPPLRERENDPVLLAEHFLRSYAEAHGLSPKHLTESGRRWLLDYQWPGNVRELGHLMERVTLLCEENEIGGELLAGLSSGPAGGFRPRVASAVEPASAEDDEATRIRATLARTGGNVLRTARLLGIGRNALRYRMRKLGIDREAETDVPGGRDAAPAPRPLETAGPPSTAPEVWEPKAVAVLSLAVAFPEGGETTGADFEPWTAMLRWERSVAERIEGFGGVFLQRSPSRLTAVFGIPRALEQTALRAVQAALSIQRTAAQVRSARPEVCAAVHAGEVHVDVGAENPTARLLPIGDTLSLPERLLGHTAPGEVLVSAAVARRIERACEIEARTVALGPGGAQRLTVYSAAGATRAFAPAEAGHGGAAAFVGRTRELATLEDAFARAREAQGQVVFVAGEAGIGKSRLVAEFRQSIAGQRHRWIEGHCASYGTRTPFLPVIDGLRRYLGIDDRDDEASATSKIAAEIERLGSDLAWTLPFVQQILSLRAGDDLVDTLDSAMRRSENFRALRAILLRAAEIEPLVLVVEDLHWIDPFSEEFFAFVVDVVPATRALLVFSHRLGYQHPFGDQSYHQRITLSPLSVQDTAAMTDSILGTGDLPAALRALIARKAEGNPFFVEELTRSLLEDGSLTREDGRVVLARHVGDISVPETIQDVLLARIDRLAEESRRAIQVASVIGREFALRLLERITEAGERIRTHVEELRGLELIYEKALHPELAYMFKHALTHDVAYESVVGERRKALHRTIGETIEELYADRLAEHYETLAHHFMRGEDWPKALRYHDLSAAKAADQYANRAVVEHCREALEIAERLGGEVPDQVRRAIGERLGRAFFLLSEFAASGAAYEQAAARGADAETRSLLLGAAATGYFWGHRYEDARRSIDAALDTARRHDAPAGEARALDTFGFYRGIHDQDIDDFERHARRSLEILVHHPHEEVEAGALCHLAMIAEWRGDFRQAAELAERVIALARRLRIPELIIFATWFLGKARCCTGDFGGAIALMEEAYQLCERIGDRAWRSRLLNTLGWCFGEIGSTQRALDYNRRAAELGREIGDPEILSNAAINLAVNHIALGDPGRALEELGPIEAALARPGDPWMRWRYSLHALDTRARIELALGDPDRALATTRRQLEGARRHAAAKVEVRALILEAEALLDLDQRDQVEERAREALTIAERIGYRRGFWQLHGLLADKERRAGNLGAAAEHASSANRSAEEAARTLGDPELAWRLTATVAARS